MKTSNEEFYKNVNWLIENKFIKIDSKKTMKEIEYERYLFDRYLKNILRKMQSETTIHRIFKSKSRCNQKIS